MPGVGHLLPGDLRQCRADGATRAAPDKPEKRVPDTGHPRRSGTNMDISGHHQPWVSLMKNTALDARRRGCEVCPGMLNGLCRDQSMLVTWGWDSCNKVAPASPLSCHRGGHGTSLFRWIPGEKVKGLIQIALARKANKAPLPCMKAEVGTVLDAAPGHEPGQLQAQHSQPASWEREKGWASPRQVKPA